MPHNELPFDYDPLKDPQYMSLNMIRYFKDKINEMLEKITEKEASISQELRETSPREADPLDQSVNEELHNNEIFYQEHEERLRHDLEGALYRLKNGTYGYCEETEEAIGVKRLMAAPQARFCLEVQKQREKKR